MFELDLEASEPIDILVSSKALCDFIYRILSPYPSSLLQASITTFTLDDAFDLYHLGKQFEIPHIAKWGAEEIVTQTLNYHKFWLALVRASDEDDENLAKKLVAQMRDGCITNVDFITPFNRLQPTWKHSLLRSIFGIDLHRKFGLDVEQYKEFWADLPYKKADGTFHFTKWIKSWEPKGRTDAEL